MAKVKVPQFRSPRSVTVDPDATNGAVVGVNLVDANGNVVDLAAMINAAIAAANGTQSGDVALADVQARADAPLTVAGSPGEGAFTYGWAGTTTYVPEPDTDPTNLYFTDERAQDAVADVRNHLPNGSFDVWQNGTSFTNTGTGTGSGSYDADCAGTWAVLSSVSTERVSAGGEGLPVGCRYYCRDTVTGDDDPSALLFRSFNIEGTKQFEGRSVTVPMYVRAHQDCVVGVQFVQQYGAKSGASLGAASAGYRTFELTANEWTLIAPEFEVPRSSNTLEPDANTPAVTQLRLYMNLGAAWGFPDPQLGTADGTFDWALVTVREGGDQPILTPLDETIRQCERYFEKSFDLGTAPAQNAGLSGAAVFPQVVAASTASVVGGVKFRERKPYQPDVTLFNPTGDNAHVRDVTQGSDWDGEAVNYRSESGFYVSGNSPAGSAPGDGTAFHWAASARGDAPPAGPVIYQRDVSDASVRVSSDGSIRICKL